MRDGAEIKQKDLKAVAEDVRRSSVEIANKLSQIILNCGKPLNEKIPLTSGEKSAIMN